MSSTPHAIGGTDPLLRLVYCTFPDAAAARRAGDGALRRRLAACINSFAVDSKYHWKGRLESTREVVVLFKTTPRMIGPLFEYLARSHPYSVPDIFELPVARGHRPYLEYLADTLEKEPPIPPAHEPRRGSPTRPGSRRGRAARAPRRTRAPPHRPSRRIGRPR